MVSQGRPHADAFYVASKQTLKRSLTSRAVSSPFTQKYAIFSSTSVFVLTQIILGRFHAWNFPFLTRYSKLKLVADPGIPRQGRQPQRVCSNLLFGLISPENCAKMKEFESKGKRRASLAPLLDPPMQWTSKTSVGHAMVADSDSMCEMGVVTMTTTTKWCWLSPSNTNHTQCRRPITN